MKIYILIIVMVSMTNCNPTSATVQASNVVTRQHATARNEREPVINYFSTCWIPTPLNINPYVRCVFQDKAGNFWFGTDGRGVCRYDGNEYTYFTAKDGLGNDYVKAIKEYKDGIWFTTQGGMARYDGMKFVNFPSGNKDDGC